MTTLDVVPTKEPEPSAEDLEAKELIRLTREQGLSAPTGRPGLGVANWKRSMAQGRPPVGHSTAAEIRTGDRVQPSQRHCTEGAAPEGAGPSDAGYNVP